MPTPQFDINNVLKRAMSVDISTQFQPYSKVVIDLGVQDNDGNEIIYWSGDDTGRTLTIDNPWGTQAQADNILAAIRGYTYQPYEAHGALLDPAAEIGDGVSVNDVYGGVYKVNRTFSSLMSADVSAPQSEEIDHEYPYESKSSRDVTRRFSAMESELRMTSAEISAKVSETGGNSNSFAWSLTSGGFSLISQNSTVFRCTSSGVEINGKITATSGKIGGFELHGTYMNYNDIVQTTTDRQGIYLGQNGLRINGTNGSYFLAQPNGNVEANNLRLRGTLYFADGSSMNSSNLRSGAQAAYNWNTNGTATGWSGTTTAWNNATQNGATSFPTYFTATNLTVKNRCTVSYLSATSSFGCPASFQVGGIDASWKEATINGTTIRYLGRS